MVVTYPNFLVCGPIFFAFLDELVHSTHILHITLLLKVLTTLKTSISLKLLLMFRFFCEMMQ